MKKRYLVLAAMAAHLPAPAQDVSEWEVGAGSSLAFRAIQQGAEFEGAFDEFQARIRFDAERIEESELLVVVDVSSIDTGHAERDEVLSSPDLLDSARWPQSRFVASEIRVLGKGVFEAHGELTIRDQTRPLVIPFEFSASDAAARLAGEVVISRLDFGVGQGEWVDTTWVGRDVTILFDLALTLSLGRAGGEWP